MPSEFSGKITADGSSNFPAEAGRYHIYGSYLCPFACRVMMVRSLKGLQDAITMDILDCVKDDAYWNFGERRPGSTTDSLYGCNDLMEIYQMAQPGYAGKVSVPVLWDKTNKTIVNNDSAEISEMLATEMDKFCSSDKAKNLKLYPSSNAMVDEIFQWINSNAVGQVYKPLLATSSAVKTEECNKVFQMVSKVEEWLKKTRYAAGNEITKADIHLFPVILRIDTIFAPLYEDERTIAGNHATVWAYLRDMYQMPEIQETVNLEHIHTGYMNAARYNPEKKHIPMPELNFNEPHGRA